MSSINDALELLLKESEPIIYDYDDASEFIYITIDYTLDKRPALPIEMLIDDTDSETMFSLVGVADTSLKITRKTAKNYLWAEMLVNDINKNISTEEQQVGLWTCSLETDSTQDAIETAVKVTFQFVLNIPKSLNAKGVAELIKLGIESFKNSASEIHHFIKKCETSNTSLSLDDVFSQENITQICLHPIFLKILKDLNDQDSS